MNKIVCEDCGKTEFTIYNEDKGILCCAECGQFKEIAKPLKAQTEPVAEVPCSVGLSAELINAIEQMAVAINLAPDDNPCVTMHPKIWLLWETILFKAGIEPDIDEGR